MLHHVEIYFSDLQRTLRFWTPLLEMLGYHESQRFAGGVSYMHENTYLCLVQAPQEHLNAGYHRKRIGLNHIAFHGRSREHVDQINEWVKSSGFVSLYDDQYPYAGGPGYYAVYCEDPDRMKVEVVAPSEL